MKRFVALILFIAILSFVACGKNDTQADTKENANTTENNAEQIITEEQATAGPPQTKETTTTTTIAPATTTTKTPTTTIKPPVTTKHNPETLPEKPNEPVIPAWKQAYLNVIESLKEYHVSYALIYIDGDDIPELYLNGDCEAAGDGVYSYKNGVVIEQRLNRTWGGRYIEKNGELFNFNGNMGCYYTNVYKLTDEGFSQTFSSLEIESIEEWVNEDPVLFYEYSVGGVVVSKDEYNQARNAAFNYEQSKPLHQNAVTYDIIKTQIEAHNT